MEEEEKNRERKVSAEKALKMERRMEREQRRRAAKSKRKNQTQEEQMAEKIAVEERKLLIAQRKLESIRLLDELLDRVKVINIKVKKRCLKKSALYLAAYDLTLPSFGPEGHWARSGRVSVQGFGGG